MLHKILAMFAVSCRFGKRGTLDIQKELFSPQVILYTSTQAGLQTLPLANDVLHVNLKLESHQISTGA